jgi:ataxin-3
MPGVTSIFDIPSVDGGGGGGGGQYTSTGVVRRASVYSHGIYHEQQEGMMCAMHAINNLLQSKTVSEHSLAQIGRALDEAERKAMNAGVNPLEWSATNREQYLRENPENNVRDDGFFGIQVIQTALQNLGLTMVNFGSEEAGAARRDPAGCTGFILNLHEHW